MLVWNSLWNAIKTTQLETYVEHTIGHTFPPDTLFIKACVLHALGLDDFMTCSMGVGRIFFRWAKELINFISPTPKPRENTSTT